MAPLITHQAAITATGHKGSCPSSTNTSVIFATEFLQQSPGSEEDTELRSHTPRVSADPGNKMCFMGDLPVARHPPSDPLMQTALPRAKIHYSTKKTFSSNPTAQGNSLHSTVLLTAMAASSAEGCETKMGEKTRCVSNEPKSSHAVRKHQNSDWQWISRPQATVHAGEEAEEQQRCPGKVGKTRKGVGIQFGLHTVTNHLWPAGLQDAQTPGIIRSVVSRCRDS